jgi:glycosyltransferase 2 family protein
MIGYQLAFLAVLILVINRIRQDFKNADLTGEIRWIAAALVLYALFMALAAQAWVYVARAWDDCNDRASNQLNFAFFASQPFKYLPTSVFTFAARVRFTTRSGLSTRRAAAAALLDAGLLVGSGTAVWLLGIWPYGTLAVSCGGVALLGTWPLSSRLWERLWDKRGVVSPPELSRGDLARLGALYGAGWLMSGLALAAVASAYGTSLDLTTIWYLIRVNAGTFAASILAVFAPAGLGVREALLLEADLAPAVVVVWRVITTAVDLGGGAVAMLLFSRRTQGVNE